MAICYTSCYQFLYYLQNKFLLHLKNIKTLKLFLIKKINLTNEKLYTFKASNIFSKYAIFFITLSCNKIQIYCNFDYANADYCHRECGLAYVA